MNVIKFKDIIKDGDSQFNDNFKGKYTYWVKMQYAVPFDDLTVGEYTTYERGNETPAGSINTDEYQEYIDIAGTDAANSIDGFKLFNNYSTDSDITLDELKVFRRWLAQTLLGFDVEYTENQEHMLQYYANDMYDDTVKWLNQFGGITTSYTDLYTTQKTGVPVGCGCSGVSATLSNLYATNLTTCDPMSVYRKNIWSLMVDTFSEIDFWTVLSPAFLQEFKAYIDNILQVGLPLESTEWTSVFADCACGQSPNSSNVAILSHLSQSLQYMIDGETSGHKNFIQKSLNDWASVLYEKMFWA